MLAKEVCKLFNVSQYKLHRWLKYYDKDFEFSKKEFIDDDVEFLKSNPFPSRSDLLKASHIETFGSNENYKKHMVDKYNSSMIDKYGKGYESSSWKIIKYNSPSYYYFNHGKRENRLEYQKHKLKDKLSVYDETLSEHDNMNNKIYRIYDCGTIKVKFT